VKPRKLNSKTVHRHNVKTYGEVEIQFRQVLTSALFEGELSASHFGRFTRNTHQTGGQVDPTAGLEFVKERSHSLVAESTALSWLHKQFKQSTIQLIPMPNSVTPQRSFQSSRMLCFLSADQSCAVHIRQTEYWSARFRLRAG